MTKLGTKGRINPIDMVANKIDRREPKLQKTRAHFTQRNGSKSMVVMSKDKQNIRSLVEEIIE
jgi:predicted GTPase